MSKKKSTRRVLMVGPSVIGAKGGISQFISQICENDMDGYDLYAFQQFKDGPALYRLLYMTIKAISFWFVVGRYDIIHIHQAADLQAFRKSYYIRVSKLFRKKVILHMHGGRFMIFYNKLGNKRRKFIVNQFNKADYTVALSDTWKRNLQDIGIKNCTVIYNGIDISKFKDCLENPDSIVYGNYALFLGRVGRRKGAYDLVEAVRKLNEDEETQLKNRGFKVIMAGDGVEISKVKDQADASVEFTGWVSGDTKIDLIKQCKFFVLPQYNEGVPLQIIEAMAAGKAIVQTNVGGIPDIVNENNGILISPGDVNALSKGLNKMFSDNNLCKELGLKQLEYSTKYSIETCKQAIKCLYDSLK